MSELPQCDDLFMQFFDRWYSEDWREWKRYTATRPDMEEVGSIIGCVARDISPLPDEGQEKAASMIDSMLDSVKDDWSKYLEVNQPIGLDWVGRFDSYYDRHRIAEVIKRSDPENLGNAYVVLCCQFGAVVGTVLAKELPSLHWLYSWPYWESMLFHPPSGALIPPFHWAIKKMSEYGVDDGFVAKIRHCAGILRKKDTST